jgi:hypothetical protein
VLCPVLTEHPLRQSHLYAIYASRKYLPLKLRTFVDHLIEWTSPDGCQLAVDRLPSVAVLNLCSQI